MRCRTAPKGITAFILHTLLQLSESFLKHLSSTLHHPNLVLQRNQNLQLLLMLSTYLSYADQQFPPRT